jgi:hypothetical protein
MSNDMKLIMESFRNNVIKEDWSQLDEQTLIQRIKDFFSKDPLPDAESNRILTQQFDDPDSYGAFAQSQNILSAMKERNVNMSKENFVAALNGLLGGGGRASGGKISAAVGAGLAIASTISGLLPASIATAAGIAGAATATIGLIDHFRKNPAEENVHPLLAKFKLDPEYVTIIDDNIEEDMLAEYEKFFLEKLSNSPEEKVLPINDFIKAKLAQKYNQHTVTGDTE